IRVYLLESCCGGHKREKGNDVATRRCTLGIEGIIWQYFSVEVRREMLLKPPLPPMEARLVEEIPTGHDWQYEPKWDGFRCIAFRDGKTIYLQSKNGAPLPRYFLDVAHDLAKLPQQQFVLDGELVIAVGGALSFDELQLRLH